MNRSNHPLRPGLPILCVDFDGVIHDYKHGWRNGEIYGALTEGFVDWLLLAQTHFRVVIYSSRSSVPAGVEAMKTWLARQNGGVMPPGLEFAHEKPPAMLTIDDRCIRFDGSWLDPQLNPERMRKFVPWMLQPEEKPDAADRRETEATAGREGGEEPRGEGLRLP